MKRRYLISALSMAISACGSKSSHSSAPTLPGTAVNPSPLERNVAQCEVYSDFRYYGKALSTDSFPSSLEAGKYVPACKKGETFFLDQCFSEILLSDDMSISFAKESVKIQMSAFDTPLESDFSKSGQLVLSQT